MKQLPLLAAGLAALLLTSGCVSVSRPAETIVVVPGAQPPPPPMSPVPMAPTRPRVW
ncbi:MAG: hypothetical protein K2X11_07065 [Acetobacteraceae bacterium]|nr:hypothetical protein [Acetobacteraceae bacterium]